MRLFTVGESTCPVPRRWLYRSPAEPIGDHFREAAHVAAAYQALACADIIYDHTELGPRNTHHDRAPREFHILGPKRDQRPSFLTRLVGRVGA